jgi:gentisate 1,2-dioxygenase
MSALEAERTSHKSAGTSDHSNATSDPMFWLDGLDIPLVQFLDPSFAEGSDEDQQKITRPAGDSFARYGRNLLPVDLKRALSGA